MHTKKSPASPDSLLISLLVATLITIYFVVTRNQVQAKTATDTTLTLTPATAFVLAPVGEVVEHTITIKNDSQNTIQVRPKVVDFKSDGKSGIPILQDNTIFSYFTPKTNSELSSPITLYANQSYNLLLEIEVPPDSVTQEYPLTILFESENSSEVDALSSGSSITQIIGSNLIILVANGTISSSRITNGAIESFKIIDSLQSWKFSILLENDSQSAALASGSAVISNVFNEVVSRQEINSDVVLSKGKRYARHKLATNEQLTNVTFSYDEPFLLGPYTVALEILQDDGSVQVVSQKTVLALPMSVFGLVIIISVFSWFRQKKYNKEKIQ